MGKLRRGSEGDENKRKETKGEARKGKKLKDVRRGLVFLTSTQETL